MIACDAAREGNLEQAYAYVLYVLVSHQETFDTKIKREQFYFIECLREEDNIHAHSPQKIDHTCCA